MSETGASEIVWNGGYYRLVSHRCRLSSSTPGGVECSQHGGICFTRRGVYIKHVGRKQIVADSNHLLFFNPDEEYRVSHPVPGGDDCTLLYLRPDVQREVLREHAPAAAESDRPVYPASHAVSPSGALVFLHRLSRWARSESVDPLGMDELIIDFAYAGIRAAMQQRRGLQAKRETTTAAHRDTMRAVKELLARRFREDLSLPQIAREVASSPFHLARLFRSESGMPVHRYLNRLRLREGLERIADGVDLTGLALDLGFSSHSHFTDAFRREFGMPPSQLRTRISTDEMRTMRKILEAR